MNEIRVSTENWWNDTVRGKPKYRREKTVPVHFVYYKSNMEWPGIEPEPPRFYVE
jgi:hypothetical protein